MRQVITVVAMNFEDVLCLTEAVGKILEGLLHVSEKDLTIEVSFRWDRISTAYQVIIGSASSNQQITDEPPKGISVDDWAALLMADLKNYLLAGNRFVLKGIDFFPSSVQLNLARA